MPRRKKDARILTIKLDRHLHELLERAAKAEGKSKTGLIEEMLYERFLTTDDHVEKTGHQS